jgi:chemotaxis protein MotB
VKTSTLLSVLVLIQTAACMTTSAHEAQLADIEKQRQKERDDASAQLKAEQAARAAAEKKAADEQTQLNTTLAARDAALVAKTTEFDTTKEQLDKAQALVGELSKRLEKLGQNVDKLTGEKGQVAQALEEAKGRLEELRKAKAAAEERAATFRALIDKLKSMIEGGQLKVTVRSGKMLIVLSNEVLFDSGKTQLKPAGKTALTAVANALASIKDRRFVVAGHTDNVQIATAQFPSNWELSTARAVEVTRLLVAGGVAPTALAASGYGEFDPVAPNDTPANKALNRRIEIEMQPNLSELPSVENLLQKEPATKG